jgi:hypothetical protein
MTGDKVDLLLILVVEFHLEIPAYAFRSCVAHHLGLQNLFLDHPQNISFFGDVAVHLRLALAINKIYTKAKRKLGFSKTLD